MSDRPTYAVIARVPVAGVADFLAYEDTVLPLLTRHGGVLERRLRSADGLVEIHLVSFRDHAAFEEFRADPERTAQAHLLERSGASIELLQVSNVG